MNKMGRKLRADTPAKEQYRVNTFLNGPEKRDFLFLRTVLLDDDGDPEGKAATMRRLIVERAREERAKMGITVTQE